ncbi:type IX secretion system membrane protein PorP/SprF [Flavobacterium sp. GSP27]|uniref:PorP/SprF family type IX secretion system membrane protein n=1 Tax=Flavobacterium sp. GSP27 TaxID=2497489 RepID=UPI000F84E6BE|nr:type IX secretion system membrane protein PorP/SprF [Flavobacterium sp. GSP27]RTY96496.1 type IX secretion system membrane protein PorP/SprF [Flavobacterium sp. GSN2]RTZ10712.1 type IX secretion system membrane protein PorP/SprF [Flavobacterium sp. GSP27]
MMNFTYIKNKVTFFLFLIGIFVVNAQENERYTQYLYNPIGINPAAAGASEMNTLFTSYRTQWVGVAGAPETMALSFNGATKNENVGLGISVMNDQIGPSVQSALAVDFAYSLRLNPNYKLAFGLKASANLLNVDFTKLYLKDGTESVFENNIDNKFSPNIGVGLYLHSDKTSIGLSVPNLLATKFYDKYSSNASNSSIATDNLNIFLTANHLFELDYNLKFKPALLVKIVQEGHVQTYASATFLVNDVFTFGTSYRFGGTINSLVGFQINNRVFIGYGYDLETRSMRNYNTASHEIFIKFNLFSKNQMTSM